MVKGGGKRWERVGPNIPGDVILPLGDVIIPLGDVGTLGDVIIPAKPPPPSVTAKGGFDPPTSHWEASRDIALQTDVICHHF